MSEPKLPLEPEALEFRPDHDGQIGLSVAISLKRIADILDQSRIYGMDKTPSLHVITEPRT